MATLNRIKYLLAFLIVFSGCASMKKGLISPELNLFKTEKAQLAEKITGLELEKVQLADKIKELNLKAEISAQVQAASLIGANNSVSKTDAGRDVVQGSGNNNDTDLMKQIFKQASDGNTRIIVLLILLLFRYMWKDFKKEKRDMDFINKQEDAQRENFKCLQENIKALMALLSAKKEKEVL